MEGFMESDGRSYARSTRFMYAVKIKSTLPVSQVDGMIPLDKHGSVVAVSKINSWTLLLAVATDAQHDHIVHCCKIIGETLGRIINCHRITSSAEYTMLFSPTAHSILNPQFQIGIGCGIILHTLFEGFFGVTNPVWVFGALFLMGHAYLQL
jgi:hypothetical protein